MSIVEKISLEQANQNEFPNFSVGDTIKVHYKIKEGGKERVQVYTGTVISRKGKGVMESITVRRISYGEGVERIFPLNSPNLEKIEIDRKGKVRRAKLYYLRDRKGKSARIAEKIKKKIGVDVSVKPEEPKAVSVEPVKEVSKTEELKKEEKKIEAKAEKQTSEKK